MLRMRSRRTVGFIELYLPSPAAKPPTGPGWLHEIKHDGFRIMACRDSAGVRLITRHGNDVTHHFPLAVAAVNALSTHSFLIDGEAIVTDDDGLAVFELVRRQRHGAKAMLCAFDLLELDGQDLRRRRSRSVRAFWQSYCASHILASSSTRITSLKARPSSKTPASLAAKASCQSGSARLIDRAGSLTGSRSRAWPRQP